MNQLNLRNHDLNQWNVTDILIWNTGIGDDLFEAFFADDEPAPSSQKKKPATTAAPVEVASAATPAKSAKPASKKTTTKRKTAVKKVIKKTTPAPPKPAESAEKEDEKPQFQHTPALLELAQQSSDEKLSSAEKLESDSTEVPQKVSSTILTQFSFQTWKKHD